MLAFLRSQEWWARQGLNLRPHPCEGLFGMENGGIPSTTGGTKDDSSPNKAALSDQFLTTDEPLTFAEDVLETYPQLARLPLRIADKSWCGRTLHDYPDLMAFYRDGELQQVWNSVTGKEYRLSTASERRQFERLSQMPDHEVSHFFADREQCGPNSKVYFIGHKSHAIKIGVTRDLKSRFQAIQMCSPIVLEVFATRKGGPARESAYHVQFSEHRLHGEWFKPHPEIFAEIERLNEEVTSQGRAGL